MHTVTNYTPEPPKPFPTLLEVVIKLYLDWGMMSNGKRLTASFRPLARKIGSYTGSLKWLIY